MLSTFHYGVDASNVNDAEELHQLHFYFAQMVVRLIIWATFLVDPFFCIPGGYVIFSAIRSIVDELAQSEP